MANYHLYGQILKNLRIFHAAQELGFDYLLNPDSGELHKVSGGKLFGPHNLALADLENFIGLANLESIPIHLKFNGSTIPVFDLQTGMKIGEFTLNKCKHCFPNLI
jgi:hypothetical protein